MEKKQNNLILFLRNNGFYLAIVLCLMAVGTGIVLLTIPATKQQTEAAPTAAPVPVNNSGDQRLSEITVVPQKTSPTATPYYAPLNTAAPTAVPTAEPTAAPTAKPASASQKAAAPVEGEIIFDFAVDKLLYSVTLDQWMTHAAVDIAADEGKAVKAVLSGTVSDVREDDVLGYTVEIKHSNGRTTLYASLGSDVRVKAGDKVNAGTVIGSVGTSAISECALPPHLHFAFSIDGKPVDPKKYVRLG
ncbi:MAG: peptidoglycan DD-metalloendopeptidase family protein [Clostridia bacterium]|nr:peptidoglycan DD-metalloendopeptidase family protein [Clostridia bacterium]